MHSFQCMKTILTTRIATGSSTIQNVMCARTLYVISVNFMFVLLFIVDDSCYKFSYKYHIGIPKWFCTILLVLGYDQNGNIIDDHVNSCNMDIAT